LPYRQWETSKRPLLRGGLLHLGQAWPAGFRTLWRTRFQPCKFLRLPACIAASLGT